MAELFFYSPDSAQQLGPLSADDLKAAGVTSSTLVWREGMGQWEPAGDVVELKYLFIGVYNASAPIAVTDSITTPRPALYRPEVAYEAPRTIQNINGMAVASFILGLLGLVGLCVYGFGVVLSILAVVLGHMSRAQIRRNADDGDGLAVAGLVLGYVAIGIIAVGLLLIVGVFITMAVASK